MIQSIGGDDSAVPTSIVQDTTAPAPPADAGAAQTAGESVAVPTETPPVTDDSNAAAAEIPTEESTSAPESLPTEIPVEIPTVVSTTEPTVDLGPTPFTIAAVSDSEQSATAPYAVDDDPNTSWSVVPSLSPREVRLTIDLGQVQDVGKLQFELGTLNTLPQVEIWLSEDGVTWWNVTSIDGTAMQTDVTYDVPLGYKAQYIAIVVPHVVETGLTEIGGIRKVSAWASTDGNVRTLDTFGPPVTPEPVATEVPLPTDVPVEENTVEAAPPAGEALPSPEESVPTDVPTDVSTAVPGGDDQPIIEPD